MVDLNYYISSLPMLKWGEKPSTAYCDFMEQTRLLLGDDVAKRLSALQLVPQRCDDAIGRAWAEFETFLRNVTSVARQAKLRRAERFTAKETRFSSVLTEHRLQEIMQMPSALEREMQLDKVRWDFLEGLAVGHRADMAGLEIYALKLLLLEKIHSRQLQAGQELFSQMVDAGLKQAETARIE